MAHIADRVVAEPFAFKNIFRVSRPTWSTSRRRLSVEAVLTGPSGREHRSDAAPHPSDLVVQLYNTTKTKVSESVHGILNRILPKIPSYPDLAAFLPNSPFWVDAPLASSWDTGAESAGDRMGRLQQEKAAYVDTLSQALSQPLLMPFIERADRVEVAYATLVADLSNMAYEANKAST